MKRLVFTLKPETAFATALHGDTLFGQCCWAIRHLFGEDKLTKLLKGYTDKQPFMVVADPLPQGFIARPTLPAELLGFDTSDTKKRKAQKGRKWLPVSVLTQPLKQWADSAKTETDMMKQFVSKENNKKARYLITDEPQDHNSLNRLTGTTGKGEGFAPFQRQTFYYHPDIKLSLIVELDENRFSIEQLLQVLTWIGLTGYGKEASCGLGKFTVQLDNAVCPELIEGHSKANAYLTLAACAPQGLNWKAEYCYYSIFTRFGRHGDMAVHSGSPFKNPVLLAAPYAVLTPDTEFNRHFTGNGLTGVSKTIEQTVQQGYAPVLPIHLEI